jgi:hypothetical protein
METKFYKIETPNNSHYAVVKPSKTGKPEIVLGGKEYICVNISAPNNDLNIRSEPECYLGQEYPNQPKEAKEMLRAAILLTKKTFGNNCNIELTDFSDRDGTPLSSVMIVFHQKTWYEKWFGAYLKNPAMQRTYNQAIQRFYDPEFMESSEYFEQLLNISKVRNDYIQDILSVYKRCTTYKEFFKQLRRTFPPPLIYIMIKPWITTFIDRLGLGLVRREPWIIPCSMNEYSDYVIQPITKDPYKGEYTFVTKRQLGGGTEKKLSNAEKRSLQMPNWIGWLHVKDEEYDYDDREYLTRLRALHNVLLDMKQ